MNCECNRSGRPCQRTAKYPTHLGEMFCCACWHWLQWTLKVDTHGHSNESCDCPCGHEQTCERCGFYGKEDMPR